MRCCYVEFNLGEGKEFNDWYWGVLLSLETLMDNGKGKKYDKENEKKNCNDLLDIPSSKITQNTCF